MGHACIGTPAWLGFIFMCRDVINGKYLIRACVDNFRNLYLHFAENFVFIYVFMSAFGNLILTCLFQTRLKDFYLGCLFPDCSRNAFNCRSLRQLNNRICIFTKDSFRLCLVQKPWNNSTQIGAVYCERNACFFFFYYFLFFLLFL